MSRLGIDEIQLLTYKSTRFDDCFLIYSYDENQENVEIITENFMEFTELVYDHHYLLVAKKEINRNLAIYLMAFEDDCHLESTIDAIDLLVDRKRQQLEDDPSRLPSSREIRIMNKIIEKKEDEYRRKIEEILNEDAKKTSDLERQIEKQTKKIEEYGKQLDKMAQEKKEQNKVNEEYERKMEEILKEHAKKTSEERSRLLAKAEECEKTIKELENKHHAYVRRTEGFERQIEEQKKRIEEYEKQLKKMAHEQKEQLPLEASSNPPSSFLGLASIGRQLFNAILFSKPHIYNFLEERQLEVTKNSLVIIDGLGNRLFKGEEGDRCEPPLKDINSQERRRKEVIDFLEFIRINWNKADSGTDIQQDIHNWFYYSWQQFLYYPSEEDKEMTKIMFLNKLKLENTIGTIHFLIIQFKYETLHYCFAIFNQRIVYWGWDYSQQNAYSSLYYSLKILSTWTENSKFATEMEVNDDQSDIFIHTSNKDVFVENEKVVTWVKNNFNLGQQNNEYSYKFDIIPPLYNFLFILHETSFIG